MINKLLKLVWGFVQKASLTFFGTAFIYSGVRFIVQMGVFDIFIFFGGVGSLIAGINIFIALYKDKPKEDKPTEDG